jgi:metal-dependent hydrolase (beta-lactamase superfamily II)
MEIKIATLSENAANYGFLAEWGSSILFESTSTKAQYIGGKRD